MYSEEIMYRSSFQKNHLVVRNAILAIAIEATIATIIGYFLMGGPIGAFILCLTTGIIISVAYYRLKNFDKSISTSVNTISVLAIFNAAGWILGYFITNSYFASFLFFLVWTCVIAAIPK
jgi:hypothetical protein